ncbi:hypothetical protein MCEMIE4_02017 [Sphingobium cupriresistens]
MFAWWTTSAGGLARTNHWPIHIGAALHHARQPYKMTCGIGERQQGHRVKQPALIRSIPVENPGQTFARRTVRIADTSV